jgi:hypothetical protein
VEHLGRLHMTFRECRTAASLHLPAAAIALFFCELSHAAADMPVHFKQQRGDEDGAPCRLAASLHGYCVLMQHEHEPCLSRAGACSSRQRLYEWCSQYVHDCRSNQGVAHSCNAASSQQVQGSCCSPLPRWSREVRQGAFGSLSAVSNNVMFFRVLLQPAGALHVNWLSEVGRAPNFPQAIHLVFYRPGLSSTSLIVC